MREKRRSTKNKIFSKELGFKIFLYEHKTEREALRAAEGTVFWYSAL
jgi:hypothetical protein